MAVLGVNCTRHAIFIAKTEWVGGKFRVEVPWPRIEWAISDPGEIIDVYRGVKPVLEAAHATGIRETIVLACPSGQYRAANETVKAEGIFEFAATELGLAIRHVTPQSLKKALACASKEKWQDVSKQLFNRHGAIEHWSEGMNGAVAAAYKATKP